jgi:hypothetical protein
MCIENSIQTRRFDISSFCSERLVVVSNSGTGIACSYTNLQIE